MWQTLALIWVSNLFSPHPVIEKQCQNTTSNNSKILLQHYRTIHAITQSTIFFIICGEFKFLLLIDFLIFWWRFLRPMNTYSISCSFLDLSPESTSVFAKEIFFFTPVNDTCVEVLKNSLKISSTLCLCSCPLCQGCNFCTLLHTHRRYYPCSLNTHGL